MYPALKGFAPSPPKEAKPPKPPKPPKLPKLPKLPKERKASDPYPFLKGLSGQELIKRLSKIDRQLVQGALDSLTILQLNSILDKLTERLFLIPTTQLSQLDLRCLNVAKLQLLLANGRTDSFPEKVIEERVTAIAPDMIKEIGRNFPLNLMWALNRSQVQSLDLTWWTSIEFEQLEKQLNVDQMGSFLEKLTPGQLICAELTRVNYDPTAARTSSWFKNYVMTGRLVSRLICCLQELKSKLTSLQEENDRLREKNARLEDQLLK